LIEIKVIDSQQPACGALALAIVAQKGSAMGTGTDVAMESPG
jgi:hypothetical protein